MNTIDSTTICELTSKIEVLQKQDSLQKDYLTQTNYLVESLKHIISTANDSIANQLSSISLFLTIIGIVVGITSAIIAIVISWYYKKIIDIKSSAELAMKKSKDAEQRSQEILSEINGNKKKLFQEIIVMEVDHLINKLDQETENIANIHSRLSVFDISELQAKRIIEIIIKNSKNRFVDSMNMITMIIPCSSGLLLENPITKRMIVSQIGGFWGNLSSHDVRNLFSELKLKRKSGVVTLSDIVNVLTIIMMDDDNDKTYIALHSLYETENEFNVDFERIPQKNTLEVAQKRFLFELKNGV